MMMIGADVDEVDDEEKEARKGLRGLPALTLYIRYAMALIHSAIVAPDCKILIMDCHLAVN